jgi:hypothetical protein
MLFLAWCGGIQIRLNIRTNAPEYCLKTRLCLEERPCFGEPVKMGDPYALLRATSYDVYCGIIACIPARTVLQPQVLVMIMCGSVESASPVSCA